MDAAAQHKSHHVASSGAKAQKKAPKSKQKGNNVKAFVSASSVKANAAARRSADVEQRRLHVPMVDRTPQDPPPVIVAVMGPPGVGKSTLIRSLVRRFAKHTLSDILGPVTVVSGKTRRLTFVEVPNDLNAQIDIAKVADLVLLLIDGNFGFEMETMEFLNILAPHGMPKVMGVLTHLDLFKTPAALRAQKKRLKNRFWTEIYAGAKLFYLSGVINGRYPDREVLNLSRFISVMKFRPLQWRNQHSYVLADRVEDVTPPQDVEDDPKILRSVTLYGYLHGVNMHVENVPVHIPGLGDVSCATVSALDDPCPAPGSVTAPQKRRSLSEKRKLIYGPMSEVGGVLFDGDAVYVNIPTNNFDPNVERGAEVGDGERMIMSLQQARHRGAEGQLQIFSSQSLTTEQESGRQSVRTPHQMERVLEEAEGDGDEDDNDLGSDSDPDVDNNEEAESGVLRALRDDEDSGIDTGDLSFAESDSEMDFSGADDDVDEPQSEAKWKRGMSERTSAAFQTRKADLNRLLYDADIAPEKVISIWHKGSYSQQDLEGSEDEAAEANAEFFTVKRDSKLEQGADDYAADATKVSVSESDLERFEGEEGLESVRSRFITGNLAGTNETEGVDESSSEVEGDFEDLEAEENEGAGKEDHPGSDGDDDDDADGGDDDEIPESDLLKQQADERSENARKKEEYRLRFEEEDREGQREEEEKELNWHDKEKAKISTQLKLNEQQLEALDPEARVRMEGYRAGTYVRVLIHNVPHEFLQYFNPRMPVIIGGIGAAEEGGLGMIQTRLKKHRWHKKILKTNDPLIISLGWRRFQTCPIYSISDSRTRNRLLKYTPEHMHCFATFWGHMVAPNTGFCAVQHVAQSAKTGAFRIAATGTVLSINQTTDIFKKLKLTGVPTKVYKNTAFIKDMFTSALEVAKFEGAMIRTVSGIRGQVKKALTRPEGHFRATFEDKILLRDIVFLRAWYPIRPRRYCNIVTNLLMSDGANWQGMRLTGQVRAENEIKTPLRPDSQYKKIERPERKFNPLRVPRALQSALPYASKQLVMKPQRHETYMQKRAVIVNEEEHRARDLMQKLMTLQKDKLAKRREQKQASRARHVKELEREDERRADKRKAERKEWFEKHGHSLAPPRDASAGRRPPKRRRQGNSDDAAMTS